MTGRILSGLYICEGSSDEPLGAIVEALFLRAGLEVRLSCPAFEMLPKVAKDVESRVRAGLALHGDTIDLVVVHRDADNVGRDIRKAEILEAVKSVTPITTVPVIPVRMTEAWLLLDEEAIRQVAGNPRGSMSLNLPTLRKVESVADPKQRLKESLLTAADCTGRRREQVAKRFNNHRRQLLEWLDCNGPVTSLRSWQQLNDDISSAAKVLSFK